MSLLTKKSEGLTTIYINGKNFRFCVNITEGSFIITENINQRWKTLYYYLVYGDGQGFDANNPSKKLDLEPKKICDSRCSLEWESATFESFEAVEIIGFNTINKDDIWEAELINVDQKLIKCEYPSIIFCFNGSLKVNDKVFRKYNFSYLDKDVEYELELNDSSEVGLFKLINGI